LRTIELFYVFDGLQESGVRLVQKQKSTLCGERELLMNKSQSTKSED